MRVLLAEVPRTLRCLKLAGPTEGKGTSPPAVGVFGFQGPPVPGHDLWKSP